MYSKDMTRVSMLVGVGLSPGGRLERGCTEHAGGAPAHRSLCHFWQHAHNVAVMQALDACNVYIESIKEEVEGAHTRQICLRQATYAGLAMTGRPRFRDGTFRGKFWLVHLHPLAVLMA